MREERRMIQTEVSVYIAEDGTEFDCEDDCESYEIRLIEKRLVMYNHRLEKVDTVDSCQYAKLSTPKEVDDFIAVCKYEGVSCGGIKSPGLYTYAEGVYGRKDAWINISNIIKSIEEKEND